MVLLSTPPPLYGANRKTTQEKKRRDEINAKIRELQLIIQNDSDGEKMTQGDVLDRAVELVHRMESESPGPSTSPNRKGFFDGFLHIENLTYSFIKSLGVCGDVCNEFIQKAKEAFDRERTGLLMTVNRSSTSPFRRHKRDGEGESPSVSPGISMDRKEVKKNREQDRRDRQGEAFDALKNFIIVNKLMNTIQVEKMQRLNTLDIIINYIKNKKQNNFVSSSGQEKTLYTHAVAEGEKTAKTTAFAYFKSDRHLTVRCAELEKYFEFSLNPKPLMGFPSRLSTLPQLPTAITKLPLSFPPFPLCPPIYPFRPFPFLPIMGPTPPAQSSPTYSLDSPPPSSDTSSSSIETSSTPNENSMKKRGKLFRPWE